jgi:hypothetical protein
MNKQTDADYQKLSWYGQPSPGHYVHFYHDNSSLLAPLCDYLSSGLKNDETCIIIATEGHVTNINKLLENSGLDVNAAQSNGTYIVLDAAITLSQIMIGDMPDKKLFDDVIGSVVNQAALAGKPIRAYGEMVALLWQDGNRDAVISLEKLWNELAETLSFSLFCAYPELHFIMHRDAREEISKCHDSHQLAAS